VGVGVAGIGLPAAPGPRPPAPDTGPAAPAAWHRLPAAPRGPAPGRRGRQIGQGTRTAQAPAASMTGRTSIAQCRASGQRAAISTARSGLSQSTVR
jgi:hypothetical protein